jgi:hypothetical protein
MKGRQKQTRHLLAVLIAGMLAATHPPAAWTQSKLEQTIARQDKRSPSKHSGPLPKAEFGAMSKETPSEKILRRVRESRKKNFFPFVTDPGTLVDGQQETTALLFENIVYVENADPSYPASLAAAIVVGTIVTAKGFVSEDRTYVYSDFKIRVDQILKQDPTASLVVGGHLIASRAGASVTFPSGHISHYVVDGRGMPKVGKQYLMFLWKTNEGLPEYEFLYRLTYELSDGRAYPLDDDHFYREPEDEDAVLLLAKVKKAIAASKD